MAIWYPFADTKTEKTMRKKKAKAKAKANGNGNGSGNGHAKKLSYKWSKRENVITFKGISNEDQLPAPIKDQLRKYGFEYSGDGEWTCAIDPDGAGGVGEALMSMAGFVDVALRAYHSQGRGPWKAEIEGGGPKAGSKDPNAALIKAYTEWNKAGRPIDERPMIHALDQTIEHVAR